MKILQMKLLLQVVIGLMNLAEHIGKTFNEGYEKSSGDWVMRMDIDYLLHENSILNLRKQLLKYSDYPGVVFPQYQFTPDRFQLNKAVALVK